MAIRYNVSNKYNPWHAGMLRRGVDSLAQWLEHWISIQGVLVSNPVRNAGFFKLSTISSLRMFIFVRWGLVVNRPNESKIIISRNWDVLSPITSPFDIICRGWKGWVGRCVASINNTAIRNNEKVGAFRVNKTQKGELYRGTYPYYFNMGVPPPPPHTHTPGNVYDKYNL